VIRPNQPPDRPVARVRDVFGLGVGLALLFGFLEGVESAALRHLPYVQALNKVSLDILWVAPSFHLALNALAATLMVIAMGAHSRIWRSVPAAFFAFVGALGVTLYSGAIGRLSSIILAVGVAVQVVRLLDRPWSWLWLRRLAVLVLVVVLTAPVAIRAYQRWTMSSRDSAIPSPDRSRANVLFLVLDTVRADYLSSGGFPSLTSPSLDRFATRGTRFTHAYSPSSWTLPSHASMLTGLPVSQHGAASGWDRLDSDTLQLQEVLQRRGYATAAFVANTVNLLPEWGFGQGFDTFDVYDTRTLLSRTTFGRSVKRVLRWVDVEIAPTRPASVVNARFREWVSRIGDRPFFALLNYMDAHEPYGQPGTRPDLRVWDRRKRRTSAENQRLADAYVQCIRDLDRQLGAFFEDLARETWWDRTLVVVVSDHGEAIADGTFDHGTDLLLEQIHVPLILRMPGRVPAGLTIDTPVSTADLAATVEELTGSLSSAPLLPGRSLTRFFAEAAQLDSIVADGILAELVYPQGGDLFRSVVLDGFQYIVNARTGVERLYNVEEDPNQERNLASESAGAMALTRLREALQRHGAPAFLRR
jgi:arylsulfatase A-like enzyme